MENSRIIELMAKKAGREANPEELEELYAQLVTYPEYAYFHEIVNALKGNADHIEMATPREEVVNHGWQDLSGKLSRDSRFGSSLDGARIRSLIPAKGRWVSAAAVLVLVFSGILLYHKKASGHLPVANGMWSSLRVTKAGYGKTAKLILSDGTVVWLNAGSKLSYPDVFSGPRREVTLEGEAFFDVAKDEKAPFSVHAGKLTVGVLGTTFNVKAYREDANFETTLITGKIQVVLGDDPDKRIVLTPHEKLTVINTLVPGKQPADDGTMHGVRGQSGNGPGHPARVYNALRYQVQALPGDSSNNFAETAWMDHKLMVSNESFETVAHVLERKYNIHVCFEDEAIRKEHISGVFVEKEDIGKVLSILKMTTRFYYRMAGDSVYLSNKRR